MDKVEGWIDEEWVGSNFAACMWLYTNAVLCDGQAPTQEDLRWRLSIIRECVRWVLRGCLVGTSVGNGIQCSPEGE